MTDSETNWFSETRDLFGYVAIYKHPPDEPFETLDAATKIFCELADDEAKKDRKTYVLALGTPPPVLYLLPFGHPMISEKALTIMYHLTPDGRCIRMEKPKKH